MYERHNCDDYPFSAYKTLCCCSYSIIVQSPQSLHSYTAITCSSLPNIDNGMILYSSNTTRSYGYGTNATYQCDEGFSLDREGDVRTCVGNGSSSNGTWNGQLQACTGITYYCSQCKVIRVSLVKDQIVI